MKRTFLLLAAALLASAAVVMTAGATSSATPGVTAKSILLEGTFPLSGPASGYAPIPAGMEAYFTYVNAKGGVNGRKINFKYDDDGYNPANTVQLTHKFVEQDHAFALVGGLGTEPQTAVRQYLNDNKVPQLFVSTGATTFDRDWSHYPWTIGWQPDYEAEGAIYGKYIVKNFPTAKLGVLYQNDDYGNDYLRGLKAGLTQQHATADRRDGSVRPQQQRRLRPRSRQLKASGADTFVIFATPTPTIQSYVIATKLGWTPAHVITNSVSATDTFLTIATKSGSTITNGTLTVELPARPGEPDLQQAAGHEALPARSWRSTTRRGTPTTASTSTASPRRGTTVQVLQAAGKNLTRAGLMKAARNMNYSAKREERESVRTARRDILHEGWRTSTRSRR